MTCSNSNIVFLTAQIFTELIDIIKPQTNFNLFLFFCKNKELLNKEATLCLYGDRISIDGKDYPFDELAAITLLGKNKLNIYEGKEIYQIKSSKRFNALKYLNLYHRSKNIQTGEPYGQV